MFINNIPPKYKLFILELLKRPELRDCLEHNELGEFYKRLNKISTKEFKPLQRVWDRIEGSGWRTRYFINIDGEEVSLAPAADGIWLQDIKELVNQLISKIIEDTCSFGENNKILQPYQYRNDESLKGTFTVPDGVTVIPEGCFSGCTYINEIILPESCTEIKSKAFEYCESLEKLTIKSRKISFGTNSLHNTSSLYEIKCANPKAITQAKIDKAVNWGARPKLIFNGKYLDPTFNPGCNSGWPTIELIQI